MANVIQEILASDVKHKEQVGMITEIAKSDPVALALVFELLRTGSDVDKGTAAEVMKFVSHDKPEMMAPYINILIEYIDYKAPRVQWGCPESIGNLAHRYPSETAKAVPKLLANLKDPSTVVRWCAAYAITNIALHNPEKQRELIPKMTRLSTQEKNNGVRNVYLKTLKSLGKTVK
jgi:hypothetical protein